MLSVPACPRKCEWYCGGLLTAVFPVFRVILRFPASGYSVLSITRSRLTTLISVTSDFDSDSLAAWYLAEARRPLFYYLLVLQSTCYSFLLILLPILPTLYPQNTPEINKETGEPSVLALAQPLQYFCM